MDADSLGHSLANRHSFLAPAQNQGAQMLKVLDPTEDGMINQQMI